MFHKYPMCLFQGGDVEAAHVIVYGEDDEAAKRAEGFRGAWEPQEKGELTESTFVDTAGREYVVGAVAAVSEPAKRKPGRPRKAEQ